MKRIRIIIGIIISLTLFISGCWYLYYTRDTITAKFLTKDNKEITYEIKLKNYCYYYGYWYTMFDSFKDIDKISDTISKENCIVKKGKDFIELKYKNLPFIVIQTDDGILKNKYYFKTEKISVLMNSSTTSILFPVHIIKDLPQNAHGLFYPGDRLESDQDLTYVINWYEQFDIDYELKDRNIIVKDIVLSCNDQNQWTISEKSKNR